MQQVKREIRKKIFRRSVKKKDERDLGTYLSEETGISKQKIKHAMNSGAVWRKKEGKGKLLRVRRASSELYLNDWIEMHYDEDILSRSVEPAEKIVETKNWGIWHKTSGMLAQGNEFGDHLSLLRQVEKERDEAYLVHRLDREVSGLMLIAYTSKAAGAFSKLWQAGDVRKIYLAEVQGNMLLTHPKEGTINDSLDGKEAITHYKVVKAEGLKTLVEIEIETGRYHQIRRHFHFIGYALMGDPRYGVGNKNEEGLRLVAYRLIFTDPISGKKQDIVLPEKYLPFSSKAP